MSTIIPYVIIEYQSNLTREDVLPNFGMIQQDKLSDFLLTKMVNFVYHKIDVENINSVADIENLRTNIQWEAMAVINGLWINVSPSNEELFNAFIKEKNTCYISSDEEDIISVNSSVNSVESIESLIVEDDLNELSYELAIEIVFDTEKNNCVKCNGRTNNNNK